MSSPDPAENHRPKTLLGPAVRVVLAVVLVLAGPVMIGVGSRVADAHEDLARTGVHTTGTVLDFNDARRASQRDIRVRYTTADGTDRVISATVGHGQQPTDGAEVTVVYREEEPGQAIVLGYESYGITVRGVGTILTMIFIPIVLLLVFSRRGRGPGNKVG
ncbi:DUF3592 domain-containing protein [Arthrobacter sp. NPDC058097]|uniref:DUF3592 domain-containing protein n=1 Tax=Arthrobacter sp. NPDC058097 TaxID=3346340 RepID=UPI0036DAC828